MNFCSKFNSKNFRRCVSPFSIESRRPFSIVCRPNFDENLRTKEIKSKIFRFYYERGDLPCSILHTTKGQSLKWFIEDFQTLNINFYLPIFIDGLCEEKYPYSFIAFQGTLDLIEKASNKIDLETLRQLIQPLRRALNTENPMLIRHVLIVLQRLARGNDGAIGIHLVPHFEQFLPLINRIRNRNFVLSCDCDFVDDRSSELIRLIDETFVILEEFGGPDAFLNIKYSVPIYEQQIDVKKLNSNQTDAILRPFFDETK